MSITTLAVLQMVFQIQRNRSSNSSDLLVVQTEGEAGYLDSFRIPHIDGEAMLIYFEAVRPYFKKPEGIDQKKVHAAVIQSRDTTILRHDGVILCQQLGTNKFEE